MKKKKILIISDHMFPSNFIGSVRPSKLANRLFSDGYDIDVFTRYDDTSEAFPNHINIYSIEKRNQYCNVKSQQYSPSNQKSKTIKTIFLLRRLSRIKTTFNSIIRSKKFKNKFKKIFKTQLVPKNYDVVFSSFGPLSSIWCGMYVKRKMRTKIKWICDFRDPIINEDTPLIFKTYFKHIQRTACNLADKITTVSYGYKRRIVNSVNVEKCVVIPNGFDELDKPVSKHKSSPGLLKILYVGSLYGGKRNLSPLFRAMSKVQEQYENEFNLEFHYAGNEANVIEKQLLEANYNFKYINHGFLSRICVLELQNNVDILVVSTWNNKGEEGVFPGKFIEYLLFQKPIISIGGGNLEKSEIKNVILEGNLGFAYEQITESVDYPKLIEYLQKIIKSKQLHNRDIYEPVNNVVERYSFDNIIKQFEEIINNEK